VGKGIGPTAEALVRFAVSTILSQDVSNKRWSKALRRMRIFCCWIVAMIDCRGTGTE
jgi:3-methyladenine DNA glycosylase/8-oxoguanine DNA glycosylase